MHDYEIRKLSEQFYKDYPHDQYQEILIKEERSYDVVLFEMDYLADCYVCVPFKTEMRHNNDYKFRFSDRSKKHQSVLDFSKLVIISKDNYIGESSTIDIDEYKELENKWENGHIRNWSMVLNQLMIDDHFTTRINQYLSSQS